MPTAKEWVDNRSLHPTFGLPADGKHTRRLQIFRAVAYAWLDEMTHSTTYKGETL